MSTASSSNEPLGVPPPARVVSELVSAAWTLGALHVALNCGEVQSETNLVIAQPGREDVLRAAADVLAVAGLAVLDDAGCHLQLDLGEPADRDWRTLAAHVAATLGQVGALSNGLIGDVPSDEQWAASSTAVLQAQGLRSASLATILMDRIIPKVPKLTSRLATHETWMLDVGAGTAQLALAVAQAFPLLRAVALEPHAVPLALAADNIRNAGLSDRVTLVQGRIETFAASHKFDVVWMPLDFVGPAAILSSALENVRSLLDAGGLLVGAVPASDHTLEASCARLRCTLWRGEPLDVRGAIAAIASAGLNVLGEEPLSKGLRIVYAVPENRPAVG